MIIGLVSLHYSGVAWKGSNRALLIARGTFGTLSLYTFFLSLQRMPLGTAVTVQYLSPVFTTVIALLFLGEYVRPVQWLFFACSFAGVALIKGFDTRIDTSTLLIGMLSAFSSGVAYTLVRSLSGKEHTLVIVLHFQIIGVLVGGAFTMFNWTTPGITDLFYLIMIGVCTQIGQIYLTKALHGDRVANVSVYNYLGVLYALFFGWVFFDEHYNLLTVGGIVLVLAGVILNVLYQRSFSSK